ncbi:MAG: ferrochelatase [Gammaproteobacteria bacterium]|nr:ferrochelatase [Gammaproteobacteria bacterium]NDG88372.1 ferrochelatase [Gammaproteobacteria bacterium]
MNKKTGVLLIQLGTPDSPSTLDVARYLGEFLNDPRVIDLPWLIRRLLVNGIIVPFRSPKSAKIYRDLFKLNGGRSPLLEHAESVQALLQQRFKGDQEEITIEMAMRYQSPSIEAVLERMRKAGYSRIILIPLFPQYASASTGSAIEKALQIIQRWWVIPELSTVSQFYDENAYLEAVIDRATPFRLEDYDHVLFSYHGLPERQVDKVYNEGLCSDQPCDTEVNPQNQFCYKATCYATTRLLVERLGLDASRYTTCFQSRLSKQWLEPFSDHVIEELAKKGARKILVFSPAFVADCLETLIEISVEYQGIFEAHGGEKVELVPSLNDHPRFIDCLESMVRRRLS